jgi:hypothetical protein
VDVCTVELGWCEVVVEGQTSTGGFPEREGRRDISRPRHGGRYTAKATRRDSVGIAGGNMPDWREWAFVK